MNLNQYIEIVDKRFKSGISREHSYRADLEGLIRELVPGVDITNEPANVTDCGNPDYVITKGKIPIGFIEAKDVGKDLNGSLYKEQFTRYKKALDNLIITDYLWFLFYQNGELVAEIRIGEINIDGTSVRPATENFEQFSNLLQDFCTFISQTIKSPKKLAEMMAAKARLLENILEKAITTDEESADNTALKQQYETFKSILIHDLTPQGFADIYSQTLAYGMFAARLHDKTLDTFSRQEAAELIPKSNPFLRRLFDHVAGANIDERIKTTVDNLAEVFRATNIEDLLKNFGKTTQTQDPIIHFYETFLAAYDPKLRKARGVWYTPEPVVNFIVRGVDEILKTEFGLKDGLADTTKTSITIDAQGTAGKRGGKRTQKVEVHKVQVLDPATGTGTFLAEVVKFIYNKKFKAMQGAWSGYVEEHLIPRLNGFELLMASYSMAHLKLDMLLTETGYKPKKDQRFNIFLTNSLEEHHPDTGTLFSSWLSSEANEANNVKRDTPVMVVMGNPPYSGESANKGKWIMDLMEDYKKEPGGKEKLKERNPKWINDDYVKFMRFAQHFIEKNGEGVLAFINPHGFLDNPTFRGMRWNLLKTYDKVYTIDLHGNSKKKETAPDGSVDQNIFDIMQGVSINFFVKTGKKKSGELAQVHHFDLYGKRETKNQYLMGNSMSSIKFNLLENVAPMFYWVMKDYQRESEYKNGFEIKELFLIDSMGVTTGNDSRFVSFSKEGVLSGCNEAYVSSYSYRPFDKRYVCYDSSCLARSRFDFMRNVKDVDNISICLIRRGRGQVLTTPFLAKGVTDKCIISTLDNANIFPLYVYPRNLGQKTFDDDANRQPNLNPDIITKIVDGFGSVFTGENNTDVDVVSPIDILDYIYAILHSPTYRKKYKEFLKIDFPRIPYPKNKDIFWALVKLGGELRQLHLLESDVVENYITSYPVDGDNTVTRKTTKKDWELSDEENQLGRIWINDIQYFDQIPLTAWEFYIGGYQPAQKWLKDRKGRILNFDDILHYQKIIVALTETDRIMQEIDKSILNDCVVLN